MCFYKIGTATPSYPCFLCSLSCLNSILHNICTVVLPEEEEIVPIPILKFPSLVLETITRMMPPNEILKLAICNRRLEVFLRTRKYRIRKFKTYLCDSYLSFRFIGYFGNVDTQRVYFQSVIQKTYYFATVLRNSSRLLGQLTRRYIKQRDKNLSYFYYFCWMERFEIQRRICSLYNIKSFEWVFCLDKLHKNSFLHFLRIVLMTKFQKIQIHGHSEISAELLEEVLNRVPQTSILNVDVPVPKDFMHPNAFKFHKTIYKDALWLSIEDLFSIRGNPKIKLMSTNFDCHDLNRFLRYWANCEEDMMGTMFIRLKNGVVTNEVIITRNLTGLAFDSKGYAHILIKAKKETSRNGIVGHLHLLGNSVFFSTFGYHIDYRQDIDILRLFQKIDELEDEVLTIMGESEELQRRREELNLEKIRLQRKIHELNRSITFDNDA